MKSSAVSILLIVLWVTLPLPRALAQVAGFAEIDDPAPGTSLRGLVTVAGTADHPAFDGYELAFAHDPNPTDTWFPITERMRAPVRSDRLALWDTDEISTGSYQLRLTVFTEGGEPLQVTVGDLKVGQGTRPVEGAQSEVSELPDRETIEMEGQSESAELVRGGDAPRSAEQTLLQLASIGAAAAAFGLGSFGLYTLLRPRVRDYLGRLRVRQNRRERRRRRGGGR